MVMMPPFWRRGRELLKLELFWLNAKEKLTGRLSLPDRMRREQIIRQLAVMH